MKNENMFGKVNWSLKNIGLKIKNVWINKILYTDKENISSENKISKE